MTDFITLAVLVAKVTSLVLGSVVAVLAYRAYRRTQLEGLKYFAIGLAIITAGTVLVGIFHHLLGATVRVGMVIESVILSVGFVVMILGLYRY